MWSALDGDDFLVLPHPEVRDYYAHRAAHPDAWLAGMNRLQQKLDSQHHLDTGERMTDQPTPAATQRTAIVTGAARGIGAAVAKRLASDGYAVAVLDLDESACAAVVSEIEAAGGKGLAVGVDVVRRGRRAVCRRPRRRRARCADGARQQRRHHPRQHALQDERRRLGRRDERPPARLVPHDARDPEAHDRREVRSHRQPQLDLRPRQPRPGQLLRGQGRPAGLHEDPRHRARQVRRHRQRHRARASSPPT